MNESSKTDKTLGRPLEGLVVADLTRILAGPFATLNLAHLGAKVIKVETPHGGDDSREHGRQRRQGAEPDGADQGRA